MNILAIETSCESGSIALLREGHVVESELDGVAAHSEGVLAAIQWLLTDAGISLAELDAIAFGSGPGAFTGLRLACGVAQGLALGSGKGLVAIGSLDALAAQVSGQRVLAAVDARLGEVYYCCYEREGDGALHALGDPLCCRPDGVVVPEGRWKGIGSAFKVHGDALRGRLDEQLEGCAPAAVPRAAQVALLAASRVGARALLAPHEAAPLYVRDKVALTTSERLANGGKA